MHNKRAVYRLWYSLVGALMDNTAEEAQNTQSPTMDSTDDDMPDLVTSLFTTVHDNYLFRPPGEEQLSFGRPHHQRQSSWSGSRWIATRGLNGEGERGLLDYFSRM